MNVGGDAHIYTIGAQVRYVYKSREGQSWKSMAKALRKKKNLGSLEADNHEDSTETSRVSRG